MSGPSTYEPKTGFTRWLDTRLPIVRMAYDSAIDFPTPKNLNYWWTFGGILAVCLVIQIVTGIVLAMHYVANTSMAFNSVERIMRDVEFGWLIRNIQRRLDVLPRRLRPHVPGCTTARTSSRTRSLDSRRVIYG